MKLNNVIRDFLLLVVSFFLTCIVLNLISVDFSTAYGKFILFFLTLTLTLILKNIYGELSFKFILYKSYVVCKRELEYLKKVHAVRYKYCFSNNRKMVEYCTEVIENRGKSLLDFGNEILSSEIITEKVKNDFRELTEKVNVLLTTEQPVL